MKSLPLNLTINQALDYILELKAKLRSSRKNLNEIHEITDKLLNMKIDLGGRTNVSDEMFVQINIILDKYKKIN